MKVSNAYIYMYKQIHISFNILVHERYFLFKTQGLYCHKLIFLDHLNLQKLRYWDECWVKSKDESYRQAIKNFSGQNRFLGIGALQ